MSNDSTDSNSGGNLYLSGGLTVSGQAAGAGQLGPGQLSHVQRVGSFRSRLKKQNPICMPEPPPIVVETPSKSVKPLPLPSLPPTLPPHRSGKPTMVVFGPSTSVDSGSSLGASRHAVTVQMCDDTALIGLS